MTTGPTTSLRDRAVSHLVRAAVLAPSPHNSQPWSFTRVGGALLVYADGRRRLRVSDPDGRQLVISCGAALFNIRLTMRQLGFQPVVSPFPDSGPPALLARVEWGAYVRATADEELMHRAMRRRHTHRGPFSDTPVTASLIEELRQHAHAEGAELHSLDDSAAQRRLIRLVRDAEVRERRTGRYVQERDAWTRWYGDDRADGVHAEARAFHPDCTALAGRDYTGVTRRGAATQPRSPRSGRTGVMVLLTTRRDTRRDWLHAGQALQRVLLYAAGHDVTAGFHTQPLEFADLRASVRTLVPSGQHPQLVLRLGHANWLTPAPRRPVSEVLTY
ncbi:Acg family FMN-binding oxidoreductase [Streptomyces longispororuber]|uniref:Acg family FMN-binding oxidoreductase n=1 Tax=Streptomyces longispororuber TaxID=68230 RepID=UPI0037024811